MISISFQNLIYNNWLKILITLGCAPCPRKGHASTVVGHNLIIQGGLYFEDEKYKKNTSTYGTYLKVS